MKKSFALTGVMILAAVLLILPVGAKAEMYVEGYLGGVQGSSAPMDITTQHVAGPTFMAPGTVAFEGHSIPGRLDPAVMGGLKLGTWFVKEGFLGMNYPDWMKYFGFYLDFSYHRLNFRTQRVNSLAVDGIPPTLGLSAIPTNVTNEFFSEGTAATLAFMFAARYGFLPDSEVPFGRLQPYIAVGPAILFSSQEPQLRSARFNAETSTFSPYTISPGSRSSADICLAVDAGLRWMALKNVSIDIFFKYRYANPSYSYSTGDVLNNGYINEINFTLSPELHLFSGHIGAAYHF